MNLRHIIWGTVLWVFALTTPSSCACEEELRALPGTVTGTLCNPADGQPLPSHDVTLITSGGAIKTTTNLFGRYEVNQVPAGRVEVRAWVQEVERVFETVLASGDVVEITDDACRAPEPPPPAPTGTISGCVCDEEAGAWLEDANVFVVPPSGSILVTGTDENGCFVLSGVVAGEHVLKIELGAFYVEHEVSVTANTDTAIPSPETCEPVEPPPPPPPPPSTGDVSGRVCAPDGSTWLADATVWVELPDGTRIEVTTDADGHYLLSDVPAGTQTLHIQKGSFETALVVEIPADDTLVLPEEECAIDQDVQIAIVSGAWDDVESVLLNVGIDANLITTYSTGWAVQLLSNYDALSQYDILFFNCGMEEVSFVADVQNGGVMRDNLRQFVENGGSVYASDQAYDVIELTFPEFIEFAGDDSIPNDAQRGQQMDSVMGTITDPVLALGLDDGVNGNTIELHYPLTYWVPMQSVAAQVRVYIRADALIGLGVTQILTQTLTHVPHTVGFGVGQGRVIYTSFHQEPGINLRMERALQLLVFEL